MQLGTGAKFNPGQTFGPVTRYLQQPIRLMREYRLSYLRNDIISGLTVSVILLPQAIAFAIIADLPPQMGLYAGIVAGVIGALWCSSRQMQTGPTNAMSLLVFGALTAVVEPGTPEFILAAGLMAIMAGLMQLGMGLARLGMLVNFVSHSVVVGFSTGAGILIGVRQLNALFGLSLPRSGVLETVASVIRSLPEAHLPTTEIGIGVMILLVLLRQLKRQLPTALIAMILSSLVVFFLNLHESGVAVIGELPQSLPPLADLPLTDFDLIGRLSTGAFAVGAIGLVQTMAISRSIAAQTGQRIDSNQEFVAQGLANIASGFFSGYAVSGSFARTAVNFKTGAQSSFAALFSGLFVLIALFTLAPLAAFLPRSALAGVLIITAYGMIDKQELRRIWRSRSSDTVIMLVTLFGTLFLPIEFAVLAGILLSLAFYVSRTSTPRVHAVVPDEAHEHFRYQPDQEECVQTGVIEILGDLYFGAVNHVEEFVLDHSTKYPDQRFLLLRMHTVNHIDFSGINMLEHLVKTYRDKGGDLFMVRVNPRVRSVMKTTGFEQYVGESCFLDEDTAVQYLFHRVMDPAVCIYECPVRVFRECKNLPKRSDYISLPYKNGQKEREQPQIAPQILWGQLRKAAPNALTLVDVREPREFRQGHIPGARSIPLSQILKDPTVVDNGADQIVLVCRTGRRSRRAGLALPEGLAERAAILQGGMIAWEAAGLLEAFD